MDRTNETPSRGICEKIRRSLAVYPAKQSSLNRVSYVPQEYPMPASMLPPSNNMSETKHGFKGGVVPIEFDRSAFAKGKQGNGHIVVEGMVKSHGHGDQIVGKTNSETENKLNDKFSEYIHHAKMKIGRTSSDVGAQRITRLDSVNKRASAYIDRARQRIKNSATFRAGSFQKK